MLGREPVYLIMAIATFVGAIGIPAYSTYVGAFSIPALFATVACFILCILSVIQLIGVWITEPFKSRR